MILNGHAFMGLNEKLPLLKSNVVIQKASSTKNAKNVTISNTYFIQGLQLHFGSFSADYWDSL